MASIKELKGIEEKQIALLAEQNIKSVSALLDKACDKPGRKALAASTGIEEATLLQWANMADLFRIKGVATQYANLLEAAGVDTVKELRNRNADNLAEKMAEVNAAEKHAQQLPSAKMVAEWVAQAKELPPKMTY